jgi:hypothetical protein
MRKAAVFALFVLSAVMPRAASPVRVMLLDGESGGPWHKWQLTTPVLKKVLEDGGFQVDVVTAPPKGRRLLVLHAEVQRLPRRGAQLRRARRSLVRRVEDGVRSVRLERRRPGQRARG